MASSKPSSASSWQGTILTKENLETYTDWLVELRDHVYSHGSLCGELMEHHLIGEPSEIPVVAGGPETMDDDSQQVIGIDAGRRRQMHSAKTYDNDMHRLLACRSYARRGLLCGDMPMRSATMSVAQLNRFIDDVNMQDALIVYQWISTKHMIADAGTKFYTKAVADALIPRICGQLSTLGKRNRSRDNA